MQISVIGAGYVGLVASACFADAGHNVFCVDKDAKKIASLSDGILPIYEPGLKDVISRSRERLRFSTDLQQAVQMSQVIFICVPTPSLQSGAADISPTLDTIRNICDLARDEKFLVLKSTVPVGTAASLQQHCTTHAQFKMEIISNPEFLKEGAAVEDFLRPDRVIIGCRSERAREVMREIYQPFVRNGRPILFMDNNSAELTKYAANAFLTMKISFINEMARLADRVNADIDAVKRGFTSDSRINPSYFYHGIGFGGSCFPKDLKALIKLGEANDVPMHLIRSADQVNTEQLDYFFSLIKKRYPSLMGLHFGVWGLSFKPRTDDIREAPAIALCERLLAAGAKISVYDPVAINNAKQVLFGEIEFCSSATEAVTNVDGLIVATEWNEFRNPDLVQVKQKMRQSIVFDGRNVFDEVKTRQAGFEYYCIGQKKT